MLGDFTPVMADKHRRKGHLDAPTQDVTLWVSFWVIMQEDINKTGSSIGGRDGIMVYHGKEREYISVRPLYFLKKQTFCTKSALSNHGKKRTIK